MTEPKYKPIPFTAPMVRAILEGRKTQTRRIVKPGTWNPTSEEYSGEVKLIVAPGVVGLQAYFKHIELDTWHGVKCPYGQPGDRLWVKETYCYHDDLARCLYKADGINSLKWNPSIHMPRWASRITLEITGVRVERLQDISEDEVFAEGIEKLSDPCDVKTERAMKKCLGKNEWDDFGPYWTDPIFAYRCLWNSIHGPGSWDKNPWVWVIEFKRVDG